MIDVRRQIPPAACYDARVRKRRVQQRSDLIYDVGMNNGDDTAFYLYQGFRVVAIEADPVRCESARKRFADAIQHGRLTILNVGIAEREGTATFWVCESVPEWSSFEHRVASRRGSPCHSIEVHTMRFRQVLEQFSIPEYLKIDIEGADPLCVRDLPREPLPPYISVEDWIEAGERGSRMLELLYETGYRRFKLLEQSEFEGVLTTAEAFFRRCVRSAAYRLRPLGLSQIPRQLAARYDSRVRNGYSFEAGSSGPWGEGVPGRWLSIQRARKLHSAKVERLIASGKPRPHTWYDWHAKTE